MVLTALLNETVGGSTVIANADDTNAFTSESLVSSTANTFNPANISLMARVLSIQLAGSYFSAGEALTTDLTTASAATPEPRTTGLMGALMLVSMCWMGFAHAKGLRNHWTGAG